MYKHLIPGIACLTLMLSGIANAGTMYRDYNNKVDCKPSCQMTCFAPPKDCDLSNHSSDSNLNADCSNDKCDVNIQDNCNTNLCDMPPCCPPPPCQPCVPCCPKPPCCDGGTPPATAVPLPASSQTAGAGLLGIILMGWIRSRRAVKA